MIPIILSGGSGTRLWPISRSSYPKQFLNFKGEKTLFQDTCDRVHGKNYENPIVICNKDHRFIVAHQLQDIGIHSNAIILEPVGRNTAPAITLAGLFCEENYKDEILLVLPADHIIEDLSKFHEALSIGEKKAKEGKIVTFGIMPDTPHIGFGYIEAETKATEGSVIKSFTEKPDINTATTYVESGRYYWNSGMFMFSAKKFLQEMNEYSPDILSTCQQAYNTQYRDLDFVRINEENFGKCRSESIDYAIMEKTDDAYVIPLDAGWSDLGSWTAVQEAGDFCENGNTLKGDVVQVDCKTSFIHSSNKLVAAIGLENIIVVDTSDALLVASKDRVQEVKDIVSKLRSEDRSEASQHRLVHRPWGTYDSIDVGKHHQVKRIIVYPGQNRWKFS